ncbi:TonB-dependent receptor [Sphingomonas dokdonensis]|uniref:Vitamin B12 transporter BtuB n=1 Tax=Sphingomonas dokdonensis TaxID=344880 RepID=A0A245ZNF7_9SPHN|nr:TonB-dependent receptor [Sphingomonas dokdonensis]OWK31284.1 vitamin B12 transporter BtuB [Sphingomonas dokdonensis]
MLKTRHTARLLIATALGTVAITPAFAQTTVNTAEQAGSSTPGNTQRERFDGTADAGDSDIVVTGSRGSANGVTNATPGGGLMSVQTGTKLRSTVTRDYIDVQAGTTNSFTLIRNLPGVVVGSGDPFGSAPNLSIRGLSQTSLGFNFEGAPIGDQLSYSAFPNEWSDSENIGVLNLTRGSTDITAPVYNSVGALLQSELISPPMTPGAFASVGIGNYGLRRYFLRLETGEIGNSGIRGFVSGSRTYNEAWRGPGVAYRNHIDSKFVKEFANGDTISLVATYNESNSFAGARNPTLAQFAEFGKDFSWDDTYAPGRNTYYRLRANDRQSLSISAPSTFTLTDSLDAVVTPYYLYTHGVTNGASNLNLAGGFYGTEPTGPLVAPGAVVTPGSVTAATPLGTATMMNVDYYDQKTYGQNSYLRWNVGAAQFRLGYWYSHFVHTEKAAYQPVSVDGTVRDTFGKVGSVTLQDGRILRNFAARIEQNVNGVYADMTSKLADDKLLINFGFKFVWVDRTATSELPGTAMRTDSLSAKPLPQASIRYSFDDRNQIFADITTAFRAPSAVSSYINIYNVATGIASSTPSGNFNPEYSVGQEIGFRHHGDLVHFTIAAFNYDLTDRLVQGTQIVGGTNVGFAVNVGDQSARGVEAEIGLVPYKGFSPYVSGQYLKATTKNNYPTRGVFLPTAGKRAALSPEWVGSAGLRFDNGRLFALVEGSYVSSQYSTFMNDQELPGYGTANASLGYRFDTIGFIKKPQFTLNMTNITDEKQLVGIQGVTSNALPTRSTDGSTLIPASNPTYTIGGGFGITASLSAAF